MSEKLKLCELSGVSKSYRNNVSSVVILDDIDFSVFPGSSIAIVGPSGSGKSTLLNILGLLDTPSSGIVKLGGKDVAGFSDEKLALMRNKHIGFVFQLHYLLPQLTLIENILVPVITEKDKIKRKLANDRGMELLSTVGLSDKSLKHPGHLSVGECQRAAVVRALINEPGIILADEPTGSLDRDSSEQMGELLSGLCRKMPVGLVVVTHSPAIADKMDKTYKLMSGKLIQE